MITLSIIQLILIVYCVWAYSFVWGVLFGEKIEVSYLDFLEWFLIILSPITVWMLFIDND